jgi:hypothetical protein
VNALAGWQHGNHDEDLVKCYQELKKERVLEFLEPIVPLFVGVASSWEELLDYTLAKGSSSI